MDSSADRNNLRANSLQEDLRLDWEQSWDPSDIGMDARAGLCSTEGTWGKDARAALEELWGRCVSPHFWFLLLATGAKYLIALIPLITDSF